MDDEGFVVIEDGPAHLTYLVSLKRGDLEHRIHVLPVRGPRSKLTREYQYSEAIRVAGLLAEITGWTVVDHTEMGLPRLP